MARIPAKKVEQVNQDSHFTTNINQVDDTIEFTTNKDKYVFDKPIEATSFKGDGSQLTNLPTPEISIPTSNAIYVDSAAPSGGDGSIGKPYNDINFAVADVIVNDTIQGTILTSGSSTFDVSDGSIYKVGNPVTHPTAIPIGTVIKTIVGNTITMSNNATATVNPATVTYWTPKIMYVSGNHTATSQIEKEGLFVEINHGSTVSCYTAITLINNSTVRRIPQKITINGRIINYHSGSS